MTIASQMLDFTHALIIHASSTSAHVNKALAVLSEEIAKRTGLELPCGNADIAAAPSSSPLIIVGSEASLQELLQAELPLRQLLDGLPRQGAEGYRIAAGSADGRPVAWIVGADDRGVLFGVGKLLRQLHLTEGSILLSPNLRLCSTPAFKLRGHQLGYRPKTNAYDAWSVEQFEQYIRELALFGSNSIEILPPRTDDDATGVHMKVPPLEMMVQLSHIVDAYGLDLWIWYPNMASDYSDPATIEAELAEREDIFRRLPRIDHILIPSGDPGHIKLDEFFAWTDRVAALLKRYHPQAKLWFSPQHPQPTDEWVNGFIEGVNRRPDWLGGVVHGPWVRKTLPELRALLDPAIPIRNYPDITHNFAAQFPIPDWDLALAMTHGRECINPRPLAMKQIHNRISPYTVGSLTYSEGIYDDVNKLIWGAQDWDPSADVADTLREYARFFIGSSYAEAFAVATLALERNWTGPLIANGEVEDTLRQWRDMEETAPPAVQGNYRFQMGLLRAYYDAYIRRRLLYETDLELRATAVLDAAPRIGAESALAEAEAVLQLAWTAPPAPELRKACDELAERLFHAIGAQSSVGKYQAIAWDRGAFMDDIDQPLNNAHWLLGCCERARQAADESSRLELLRAAIRRTDPGPGGYYDNLGSPSGWRRVVSKHDWDEDPSFGESVFTAYCVHFLHMREERKREVGPVPLAWLTQLTAFYKEPLKLRYEHLDDGSDYVLRVTYSGFMTARSGPMTLKAGDRHVLQEQLRINVPVQQIEYVISREAITDGVLTLTWSTAYDRVGPFAAEVWLMRAEYHQSIQGLASSVPLLSEVERALVNGTMG
ncbi:hypothetical protein [Paenibacillus thalictri]|uniref:Alpha glucuronidase N-terminal domain-containing protein n=1 Tax=Paenibacillus thalictri TaxID=2527873 RepID=A0A4Q9DYA4_9BACL|nr:hypothetical protein [Paenibacillus thalictri]TBL81080.1 hypothetical protein EYB31_03015 [Paenibacillus thalictri]